MSPDKWWRTYRYPLLSGALEGVSIACWVFLALLVFDAIVRRHCGS